MNNLRSAIESIGNLYSNPAIETNVILAVLIAVLVLTLYELVVYHLVSHRNFFNKSFMTSLAILPFFISTIILCLQANIVITLGTIGALAIIRFRTAIKDPLDMMYILWSIYIGIVCGCQLYEVAVLTSLVVTIFLIGLENWTFGKKPYVLIIHCNTDKEDVIEKILREHTRKYMIKSRSYTSKGVDYAIELSIKNPDALLKKLKSTRTINKFSLIKYDSEDII